MSTQLHHQIEPIIIWRWFIGRSSSQFRLMKESTCIDWQVSIIYIICSSVPRPTLKTCKCCVCYFILPNKRISQTVPHLIFTMEYIGDKLVLPISICVMIRLVVITVEHNVSIITSQEYSSQICWLNLDGCGTYIGTSRCLSQFNVGTIVSVMVTSL